MKHYSFLLILFMALCLSLGNGNKAQAGSLQTKGVWVSCFEFEELGLKDKTEAQFRANANKIFATIRANGCNTVYFHVRAYDEQFIHLLWQDLASTFLRMEKHRGMTL